MSFLKYKTLIRMKGLIKRTSLRVAPNAWEWAYRRYRLSHCRRAGVVLCHIPKNGGTFVSSQLYGTNLGHIPARQQIRELADAGVTDLPVIAFVQDPVKRFGSSASHFFSRGGEHSLLAWNERYESMKTLSQLVDFAASVPDAERDPILKSQHFYLAGAAELAAAAGIEFKIYPLSELTEVIDGFRARTGRPAAARRENRSALSATYRQELDQDADLRARVRDLYSEDLKYLVQAAG